MAVYKFVVCRKRKWIATPPVLSVTCLRIPLPLLATKGQCKAVVRDHPFKTSACLRGGGGSPLPMFADARGAGVLGLPTSAINPQ